MEYSICYDILDYEELKNNFSNNSIIDKLNQSFVETHNSSITQKASTTYKITNNGEIVGYFVLSLCSFGKNSKNSNFFKQNGLVHDWYSAINLEYLVRRKGDNYKGIGDIIFTFISEIINYIQCKIKIKYIYIKSIRDRINYFEDKGFISTNMRSRNSNAKQIDMLLEI